MAERIVLDTGLLIALDRVEALDLVGRLPLEFLCPSQVRAELDAGEAFGFPSIAPSWLKSHRLASLPSPMSMAGLDLGEASVIQLALELGVAWVGIDEWKGRRGALAAGLRVTGSLGLLALAKKQGIVPVLKPFVERALAAGIRYHPTVVETILEAVGE